MTGGDVDVVDRWGGQYREREGESIPSYYVPPEDLQGGPLDVYLGGFDPQHYIPGPEYRDAVNGMWDSTDSGPSLTEVDSLCGGKSILLDVSDTEHYLETLAGTDFSEPRPMPPDIHERPERGAHRMIPGSPVTVLGISCGNCQRVFRSRYGLDQIQDALITLTGEEPGPHISERR